MWFCSVLFTSTPYGKHRAGMAGSCPQPPAPAALMCVPCLELGTRAVRDAGQIPPVLHPKLTPYGQFPPI